MSAVTPIINSLVNWLGLDKNRDERGIVVSSSDDGKVSAVVCPDATLRDCKVTVLTEYTGQDKRQAAAATAANLRHVIHNGDLFADTTKIKLDHNLLGGSSYQQIIVDNSWIPFNTATILDLSGEHLSEADRKEHVVQFMSKLWLSGIMPPDNQAAVKLAEDLSWQVKFRFRDPQLFGYLTLAGLQLQIKQYDQSIKTAMKIVESRSGSPTAPRPMYYDEAVFLIADTLRIMATKSGDREYLDKAARLLTDNERKLRSEENGYRTRYNYELARTCAIYQEQFEADHLSGQTQLDGLCQPGQEAAYVKNATFGYNLFSPAFADNFLAVRSLLELAHYKFAASQFKAADKEYADVLKLINFFDRSASALEGDSEDNWKYFSPLMHENDRFIGGYLNKEAGLQSFVARSAIDKTVRHFPGMINTQFDMKSFNLFKAAALQGRARIALKQARFTKVPAEAKQHLTRAAGLLDQAFELMEKIKRDKITEFYFAAMFEEKTAYDQIAIDYAEALSRLARLSMAASQAGNLTAQAKKTLEDEADKLNAQAQGLLKKATPQNNDIFLYAQINTGHLQVKLKQYDDALASFKLVLGTAQSHDGFADIGLMAFYGLVLTAVAGTEKGTRTEAALTLDRAVDWYKLAASAGLAGELGLHPGFPGKTPAEKLAAVIERIDTVAIPYPLKEEIVNLHDQLGDK